MTPRPSDVRAIAFPDANLTLRSLPAHELSDEYVRGITALLGRAFNGGPPWFFAGVSPEDHLVWKAKGFPGRASFELVEDGGRLVGSQLQYWRRFQYLGRDVEVRDGVDSAIDPDYQGLRLDSRRKDLAVEHGLRDADLSTGFGQHPLSRTRRGVQQETAELAASIETVMKPLTAGFFRSDEDLRERQRKGRSRTGNVVERQTGQSGALRAERARAALRMAVALAKHRFDRPVAAAGCELRTLEVFDERFDDFWRIASAPFALIQIRDREFLNWRYCDPRAGAFEIRVAEAAGNILGYSVVAHRGRDAVLADLLCLPSEQRSLRALLRDASSRARQAGASRLRTWMSNAHPAWSALHDEGFRAYPSHHYFNVKPGNIRLEELAPLSESGSYIHMMPGDSDHV